MNQTSIVVVTYNGLPYTRRCLESIRSRAPLGAYELICVDNGSSDGTAEWLAAQSDVKLIRNRENLGFPAGCNLGIRIAAPGSDILLLNNDTVVTPDFLRLLQTCLHSDPSVGAVGPVTNSCSNYQAIPVPYRDEAEMQAFAESYNRRDPSRWEERQRLIGYCLLIRREAVEKADLLDERFFPGNYEDDDYSLRLRLLGYRLLLCGDCFIHHAGSASFSGTPAISGAHRALLARNREVFWAKWGADPLLLAEDLREPLGPLLQKLPAPRSVLIVNSGFGSAAMLAHRVFPAASVCCAEPSLLCRNASPAWAETLAAPPQGRRFDLIIALTWFRAASPLKLLRGCLPLLEAGGTLLLPSAAGRDESPAAFPAGGSVFQVRTENGVLIAARQS